MAVEHVEKTINMRGKAIFVSVYDFVCDGGCGGNYVEHDVPPPPYGTTEKRATEIGWVLMYDDDERCFCPSCQPHRLPTPSNREE